MLAVLGVLCAKTCEEGTYLVYQSTTGSKTECKTLSKGDCYNEAKKCFQSLKSVPLAFKSDVLCGSCEYITLKDDAMQCVENPRTCPEGHGIHPVAAAATNELGFTVCARCPRNYEPVKSQCVLARVCRDPSTVYDAASNTCNFARFHRRTAHEHDIEDAECAVYEQKTDGSDKYYVCVEDKKVCLPEETEVQLSGTRGVWCKKTEQRCPEMTVWIPGKTREVQESSGSESESNSDPSTSSDSDSD